MRTGRLGSLRHLERGFTLLIMLGLVAVLSLGVGAAGAAWRDGAQREREAEWLRIGNVYAQAIEAYLANSPGTVKQGPTRLEDLLADTRFVGIRRHLRQAYADPLQPSKAWALLKDEKSQIVGVYSTANGEPFLRQAPAGSRLKARSTGDGYARWAFVASQPSTAASRPSK